MNISDFRESQDKKELGSPCYIGDEGSFFNVKRIHTPEYNKQIEEIKVELYGFAPKPSDVDNNLILATWLCEFGVTGWVGVDDGENDCELRYNKVNARKVLLNPEYFLSLNPLLIQHAGNYNNYLHDVTQKDIEAIKKS
jgi:hypothetical protein